MIAIIFTNDSRLLYLPPPLSATRAQHILPHLLNTVVSESHQFCCTRNVNVSMEMPSNDKVIVSTWQEALNHFPDATFYGCTEPDIILQASHVIQFVVADDELPATTITADCPRMPTFLPSEWDAESLAPYVNAYQHKAPVPLLVGQTVTMRNGKTATIRALLGNGMNHPVVGMHGKTTLIWTLSGISPMGKDFDIV